MCRALTILSLVFVLCAGSIAGVAAQGATPAAAGPDVGATVAVLGPDGAEMAQVTVTEMVDPLEDYDPNSPPQRGYHFVLLNLTVVNTGARPLEVDPNDIVLRDADGFIYSPGGVFRGSEPDVPDLAYQGELAAGGEASGAIGFSVLNGVQIENILYVPESDRLIDLVSLGDGGPGLGNAVSYIGPDGAEVGQVTVTQLVDPFEDYDPSSAPQRGSHFVLLSVTATNTGTRPLEVDPNRIRLQDADGFVYSPGGVFRGSEPAEPDFVYQGELAPGAEITGAIGFTVLNGVVLTRIVYQPASDQLIVLADLRDGSATGAPPRSTPEPATITGGATASIDCAEAEAWLTQAATESGAAMSVIPVLLSMRVSEDPEFPGLAQEIAGAFIFSGDALRQGGAPSSVLELNTRLADAFTAYGEALDQLATAVEGGDQAAIDEAGQLVFDAEPALITATGEVADLAAECEIDLTTG